MKEHKLRIPTLLLLLCSIIACSEQQPTRQMRYYPEGRDLVCLNGEGRFTRPLYGTNTRFRLETSDRPVFASYDKLNSWNIRFFVERNGDLRNLDQIAWCKASYQGGRRTYELRDPAWGKNARLYIYAMASFFEEGAIWQFRSEGFEQPLRLNAKVCRIAGKTFNRDGDLGTDPREIFEPAEGEPDLQTLSWDCGEESYFAFHSPSESLNAMIELLPLSEGIAQFDKEEFARMEIMGQVEINTPDPFLNTLGANLMAAADGIWDGKTILHGANGWRTQLAGWRGGYTPDVVGWNDRAKSHFLEYSQSMTTDKPYNPELEIPDSPANSLSSSPRLWGTSMYSNGYISRVPGKKDQMSNYDMNLNYFDELLTHFCYDADTTMMRYMWPYLSLHHEWEKRNFDPDSDHLYDAYCCIWASDALYYNGGAVTHSSAYNYRSNLLTARIAEILGEDPSPYKAEAEAIKSAMDKRLWMEDLGYWAEYQDYMGHQRLHKSAAIWSVYTPIDCGVGSAEQAYRATCYVDRSIPHIPVRYSYDSAVIKDLGLKLPKPEKNLFTISTTDWLPYVWSTNNVAHEEVANMALAYLKAGRRDSGFQLLKADLLDEMYLGACPGNFGQISYYDKARSESYRDFADNVGTSSRAIINGLFGILPDALNGQCILSPAFPESWDEASIKTPYLSYSFRREGHLDIYEIEQHFPQDLNIIVRAIAGGGAYLDVAGDDTTTQTIIVDRRKLPAALSHKEIKSDKDRADSREYMESMGLGDIDAKALSKSFIPIIVPFNANVDDIFRNDYLSPRPKFNTLQIPRQGVGDWCTPFERPLIEDQEFRARLKDDIFHAGNNLKFISPAEGHNIAYTSLWDNYPDSISIKLQGKAKYAYLLMAGSTNNMQSRIENARVTVTYTDGSVSILPLENPINWCPIQQDYYTDEYAFRTTPLRPYRVVFSSGEVSREVNVKFSAASENGISSTSLKPTDKGIPGGAAQILKMPLSPSKELKSLTLTTLSNDVVVGIMGITLQE